jgi:hypothetical protein
MIRQNLPWRARNNRTNRKEIYLAGEEQTNSFVAPYGNDRKCFRFKPIDKTIFILMIQHNVALKYGIIWRIPHQQ